MLSPGEIEVALAPGYEARRLEVKGPARSDAHLFAKVTRAALSMGNLRDGGQVVIGIDDNEIAAMLPGLREDQTREVARVRRRGSEARRVCESAPPL